MDNSINSNVNVHISKIKSDRPAQQEKPKVQESQTHETQMHYDPKEYLGRSMIKSAQYNNTQTVQNQTPSIREIKKQEQDFYKKLEILLDKICKKLKEKNIEDIKIQQLNIAELKANFSRFNEQKQKEIYAKFEFLDYLLDNTDYNADELATITSTINEENIEATKEFVKDKNLPIERFGQVGKMLNDKNQDIIKQLVYDESIDLTQISNLNSIDEDNIDTIIAMSKRKDIGLQEFIYIGNHTKKSNKEITQKFVNNKNINLNNHISSIIMGLFVPENAPEKMKKQNALKQQFINDLLDNPDFDMNKTDGFGVYKIMHAVNEHNYNAAKILALKNTKPIYGLDETLSSVTEKNKDKMELLAQEAPPNLDINENFLNSKIDLNDYLTLIKDYKNNDTDYTNMLKMYATIEPEDYEYVKQLISDKKYSTEDMFAITSGTNLRTIEKSETMVNKLNSIRDMSLDEKTNLMNNFFVDNLDFQNYMYDMLKDKNISTNTITEILRAYIEFWNNRLIDEEVKTPQSKFELFKSIAENKNIPKENLAEILKAVRYDPSEYAQEYNQENNNLELIKSLSVNPNVKKSDIANIARIFDDNDTEIADWIISQKDVPTWHYEHFKNLLKKTPNRSEALLQKQRQIFETFNNSTDKEQKGSIFYKKLQSILQMGIYLDEINDAIERKDIDVLYNISQLVHNNKTDSLSEINDICKNKDIDNQTLVSIIELFNRDEAIQFYREDPKLVTNLLKNKIEYIHLPFLHEFIPQNQIIEKINEQLTDLKKEYKFEKLSIETYSLKDTEIEIQDNNENIFRFDKNNGKLTSISTADNSVKNYTTGTEITSKSFLQKDLIATEAGIDVDVPYYREIIVNKLNGEPVLNELLVESDIEGEYEIYQTYPDGNRYKVGLAEYDKNGGKHIEKTLTALDGSKTNYVYSDDKDGNRFLHYNITDKDGNITFKTEKKFKVLSENHYQTSKNNEHYDIEIKDDKIITTKLDSNKEKTDEVVEYQIVDFSDEDYKKIYENFNGTDESSLTNSLKLYGDKIVDKRLLSAVKELSGDEWFALSKNTSYIIGNYSKPLNACAGDNVILISEDVRQNSFLATIEHEIGHEKFAYLKLDQDTELQRIYNEERTNFINSFPKENIQSISYFLDDNVNNWRGLNETCAETNQLINIPQSFDGIKDRTIILQQFFPKTIAYIANKYKNY